MDSTQVQPSDENHLRRSYESAKVRHGSTAYMLLALLGLLIALILIMSTVAAPERIGNMIILLIVLTILTGLIVIWILMRISRVRISPDGVTLVRRLGTSTIPLAEVTGIAPTYDVDTSSWGFERYAALRISAGRGLTLKLRIPAEDVQMICSIWRAESGRSPSEEGLEIQKAARDFKRRVRRSERLRNVALISTMMGVASLTLLLVPDVNVRGEEMSMPTKLLGAAVLALFAGCMVVLTHTLFVSSRHKAEMEGLKAWIVTSKARFRSRIPIKFHDVAGIIGSNYRIGGAISVAMGFMLIAVGGFSIATSPEPSSMLMAVPGGVLFVLVGFGFHARGRRMLRAVARQRASAR